MREKESYVSLESLFKLYMWYGKPYNESLIKRLYETIYGNKQRINCNVTMTEAHYDCICDMLLIPKRIRYGARKNVERYIQKISADTNISVRFSEYAENVCIKLFDLQQDYLFFRKQNAEEIMTYFVYCRAAYGMNYTRALLSTVRNMAERGITVVPIKFLYDFFNDKVLLEVGYGRYTPKQVLQSIKETAVLGEKRVTDKETYAVILKQQEVRLPIYGCISMGDYSIYNSWVD